MFRKLSLKTKVRIILLVLSIFLALFYGTMEFLKIKNSSDLKEKVLVKRVVDGDTFVLHSGDRVRLIGVDCPESVKPNSFLEYFGKESSLFAKQTIEGKWVTLEKDVSDQDPFGRLLRYVYLEDGTFLNELLLKEGYARVSTFPPDVTYVDLFLEAEQFARKNKKGLWKTP